MCVYFYRLSLVYRLDRCTSDRSGLFDRIETTDSYRLCSRAGVDLDSPGPYRRKDVENDPNGMCYRHCVPVLGNVSVRVPLREGSKETGCDGCGISKSTVLGVGSVRGSNTFDESSKGRGRVSGVRTKKKTDGGERMSETWSGDVVRWFLLNGARLTREERSTDGTPTFSRGVFSKFKVRRLRDGARAVGGTVVRGTVRRLSAKRQRAGRTWSGDSSKMFVYYCTYLRIQKNSFYCF